MTDEDMEATGWSLTLREQHAFEHLHLWWGHCGVPDEQGNLEVFVDLMRDKFHKFIVQTQVDEVHKNIKEGKAATVALPSIANIEALAGPNLA